MNYLPILLTLNALAIPTQGQASLNTECLDNLVPKLLGPEVALYEVVQGLNNPNEFVALVLLDEERTQDIWQTDRLESLALSIFTTCGYVGVEFYAAPFFEGYPLPVDQIILPGSFTIRPDGYVTKDSICVVEGVIDDIFYCDHPNQI